MHLDRPLQLFIGHQLRRLRPAKQAVMIILEQHADGEGLNELAKPLGVGRIGEQAEVGEQRRGRGKFGAEQAMNEVVQVGDGGGLGARPGIVLGTDGRRVPLQVGR